MSKLLSTPMARILLVVLLAAAVVLAFRDSFSSMFGLWSLSSYQHAYIVPPMSLLLLWMARREFAAQPLVGSAVGLVLLFAWAWELRHPALPSPVLPVTSSAQVPA